MKQQLQFKRDYISLFSLVSFGAVELELAFAWGQRSLLAWPLGTTDHHCRAGRAKASQLKSD